MKNSLLVTLFRVESRLTVNDLIGDDMPITLPYIRLNDGEWFHGFVTRIGAIDSLFPEVRSKAPSVLIVIAETNKYELTIGEEYRFTFFNPTLMRQWEATPARVDELIRVIHLPTSESNGKRWEYAILRK